MRGQFQLAGGRRESRVGPPGVILVITVLLVGLLLVMGMTMINLASSDYQVANNESRSIQALYNADAGVEEAKMRVSPNAPSAIGIAIGTAADWRAYIYSGSIASPTTAQMKSAIQVLDTTYGTDTNYSFSNTVQTGTNAIQWGWARIQHKINGGGIVYQDAVTGAETNNATQTVGTNTVYNPPILVVTAEGIQGTVRRMIQVEYQPIVSTTTTNTQVVTDPFANAVHGRGAVTLTGGAYTDSYNSNNGAYNVGGNLGSNGHVSTDATTNGAVTLTGNARINGSVQVGPGANTSTAVTHDTGTNITGTITNEPAVWNLPLSTIPAGVSNQGPLTISGNHITTLNEGTYWYSSISISGNGQLQINGAVKIYVTGSISISGNGVATALNKPPNLLIYGTVDPANSLNKCTSVSISGNGSFYGAVYAPDATINVSGNGAVYGSITGSAATINGNGGFHYDEALGNLGRFVTTTTGTTYTTTGYTRYSWREIAF